MKKLLSFLLGLNALAAAAQHSNHFSNSLFSSKNQYRQQVNQLLGQQSKHSSTAQKPTGLKQRVVAQCTRDSSGIIMDSTRYTYSAGRGSNFIQNLITSDYPESMRYQFEPTTDADYPNNPKSILADSLVSYYSDTANAIQLAHYDIHNNIDTVSNIALVPNSQYRDKRVNKFNAQGFNTASYYYISHDYGNSYTLQNTIKHFYNSQNKLLVDSGFDQNMLFVSIERYHYNTENLFDSSSSFTVTNGIEEISLLRTANYNTAGKVIRTRIKSFTFPEYDNVDSFKYSSTFPDIFTEDLITDILNGRKEKGLNHINVSGLKDTVTFLDFDTATNSWVNSFTFEFIYNDFDNPTKCYTFGYYPTPTTVAFHYETYDDSSSGGTGIKNQLTDKDLRISPNPFNGYINIDWKQNQPSLIQVKLINIQGQNVFSNTLKINPGNNEITLPQVSSGNYLLLLQDSNGKKWTQKMIKK